MLMSATEQLPREPLSDEPALMAKRYKLSSGELKVLYWSARGKTSHEMAALLPYTEKSVRTYRQRIIRKMSASNMAQAVYLGLKYHLID